MTRTEIDAVLERVKTWPAEQQEEAVAILLEIEAATVDGVYQLSEDELAEIEEGMAEIQRGEFASDEEVAVLFDRYRKR